MIIIKEARDSWYKKLLTKQEFYDFVVKSLTGQFGKDDQKAWVGNVTSEAAARIKNVCKQNVYHIMVGSSKLFHAYRKVAHHLLKNDIFHLVDVINTTHDIKESAKRSISEPNVTALKFVADINGNLEFVVLVRVSKKYKGWLDMIDCYRERKVKDA